MHPYRVGLWAIYSDKHSEVDIAGDHDGVRGLADWIVGGTVGELVLDPVPASWLGVDSQALEAIGLLPSDDRSERIGFERKGSLLVISGNAKELERIVAGPIGRLAELP